MYWDVPADGEVEEVALPGTLGAIWGVPLVGGDVAVLTRVGVGVDGEVRPSCHPSAYQLPLAVAVVLLHHDEALEDVGDVVDGAARHGNVPTRRLHLRHLAAPAIVHIERGEHVAHLGLQVVGRAAGKDEVLVFRVMAEHLGEQLVFRDKA